MFLKVPVSKVNFAGSVLHAELIKTDVAEGMLLIKALILVIFKLKFHKVTDTH